MEMIKSPRSKFSFRLLILLLLRYTFTFALPLNRRGRRIQNLMRPDALLAESCSSWSAILLAPELPRLTPIVDDLRRVVFCPVFALESSIMRTNGGGGQTS
jgi:hypothetical protein